MHLFSSFTSTIVPSNLLEEGSTGHALPPGDGGLHPGGICIGGGVSRLPPELEKGAVLTLLECFIVYFYYLYILLKCLPHEETVAKPMSRGDVSATRLSCSSTFNVSPKFEFRPLCGCFYTFKFGRKLHNVTNCTWVAVIDPRVFGQFDKIMLWYPFGTPLSPTHFYCYFPLH